MHQNFKYFYKAKDISKAIKLISKFDTIEKIQSF